MLERTGYGLDEVLDFVRQKFPNYWLGVEISLSAIATLLLKDNVNPAFLIKEGASGSGKTTIDEIVGKIDKVTVWVDAFTSKAFVSHRADRKDEDLKKIDLLPHIKHRVLITPDLAPTLGQKRDNLQEAVAVMTRVLDGQGYLAWSGAQGCRGYEGDYLFVWLASTTPLSRDAWSAIGKAGTRAMLLQLSVDEGDSEQVDLVSLISGGESYSDKKKACHEVVRLFVADLWRESGGPRHIDWPSHDDDQLLRDLDRLTKLMVDWRAMADEDGVVKDSPQRHFMLLHNLARGHAIIYDRTELTRDDLAVVARVTADSVPHWRRAILRTLIRKGELTTSDVMRVCEVSRPTAVRLMTELERIGAVELVVQPGGTFDSEQSPWRIRLLPAHRWVLDAESQWLWKHLPC
jgi:DNA-binding transcriptional ArsR family regulator